MRWVGARTSGRTAVDIDHEVSVYRPLVYLVGQMSQLHCLTKRGLCEVGRAGYRKVNYTLEDSRRCSVSG